MAVANYHDTYKAYPPAFIADAEGRPMHSWRVLLLPFIEQHALYERYDFSQPWDSAANQQLAEQMPAIYAFHGDYRPGLTTSNYLAVVGDQTLWPPGQSRRDEEIIDGSATTILFVENAGQKVHWLEPRDLSFETMSFQVDDPAGISSKHLEPAVVMLDGSLRRLKRELPADLLRALLTASGGEELEEEGDSWKWLSDGRDRPPRPIVLPQVPP